MGFFIDMGNQPLLSPQGWKMQRRRDPANGDVWKGAAFTSDPAALSGFQPHPLIVSPKHICTSIHAYIYICNVM